MANSSRENLLIKMIVKEPWMHSKKSLKECLGVSANTISQSFKELEARGYRFEENEEGKLFLREAGWDRVHSAKESTFRKILVLQYIAAHKKGLTLPEITYRFRPQTYEDVSEKTITRTVQELVALGLIEKDGERYKAVTARTLPSFYLSERDKALLFSAFAVAKALFPLRAETSALEAKLRLQVNAPEHPQDLVFVQGRTPTQNVRRRIYCHRLETAARERRKLNILYRIGEKPGSEFIVKPLGIVYYWALDSWYLVAQDCSDGMIKTYAMDRILHTEELDEYFESIEGFDLGAWYETSWGIYRSGQPQWVRIRFHNYLSTLTRVQEDLSARKFYRLIADGDGLILEDWVDGLPEMAVWLRAFGPGVEVLEPPELKAMVIDNLEKTLAVYTNETGGEERGSSQADT